MVSFTGTSRVGIKVAKSAADTVKRVARAIRAGSVHLNGAGQDYCLPFGGFKQSGNGRAWGIFGLEDCLERKVINGFPFEAVAS